MGQLYSHLFISKPDYCSNFLSIFSQILVKDVAKIVMDYCGLICNKCEYIKRELIKKTVINQGHFYSHYGNYCMYGEYIVDKEQNIEKIKYSFTNLVLPTKTIKLDKFVYILTHNKSQYFSIGYNFLNENISNIYQLNKNTHIDVSEYVYKEVDYSITDKEGIIAIKIIEILFKELYDSLMF